MYCCDLRTQLHRPGEISRVKQDRGTVSFMKVGLLDRAGSPQGIQTGTQRIHARVGCSQPSRPATYSQTSPNCDPSIRIVSKVILSKMQLVREQSLPWAEYLTHQSTRLPSHISLPSFYPPPPTPGGPLNLPEGQPRDPQSRPKVQCSFISECSVGNANDAPWPALFYSKTPKTPPAMLSVALLLYDHVSGDVHLHISPSPHLPISISNPTLSSFSKSTDES